MKTLAYTLLILFVLFSSSCNTARRAEAKRKREQEKLEQLENDKKVFEEKNRTELGK